MAINKAWTAISMKRCTRELTAMIQPGAMAYGLVVNDPRIVAFGGGMPISRDGVNYIGGIGGSGGTPEMDDECCLAALKAAGFKTEFPKFEFGKK